MYVLLLGFVNNRYMFEDRMGGLCGKNKSKQLQ